MADICGVVCECGPNYEPLACGYPDGHEGDHAWASLPTWSDRWRIVHHPHPDPKKSSMAIEGPPTDSRIVYGVAQGQEAGVAGHALELDAERERMLDLLERVDRTFGPTGGSPAGFSLVQDVRDLLREHDRLQGGVNA